MVNEREVMRHFVNYVIERADELLIPMWYVGYYTEVSDSTFRQCMKGMKFLRPYSLIMLAELFECSVNELLGFGYFETQCRDDYFVEALDAPRLCDYFLKQVTERMEAKNITHKELADYIGCTEQTLHNRFKYNTLKDTVTLLRICEALECTPTELLGY